MSPDEFDSALSLLMDNEISPEAFAELEGHLSGSEEARRRYMDVVDLHQLLRLEQGARQRTAAQGSVIPMDRVVARQKRRTLKFALLSSAAAILVAVLVSTYILLPDPPPARFKTSSFAQFSLTHSTPENVEAPEGKQLAVGSRLRLTRGTIELQFRSGTRGVVSAPADLTLRKEGLVALDQGRAWFEVPPKGVGFQIDTPEFLLTDLGTEFGVISDSEEPDQVHVFDGRVEVQNHYGDGQEVALAAGDARVVEADGGWLVTAAAPEAFLYSLPADSPLPPYLHWSFDGDNGHTLSVAGSHPDGRRIAMAAVGGTPQREPGVVGGAISFDGSGTQLHTDWPGVPGGRPRTVAFWLKLPPVPEARKGELNDYTLVHWGRNVDRAANDMWSVRATNYQYLQPESIHQITDKTHLTLELGAGWFSGSPSTELADGEWHHIAVRYNGDSSPGGRPVVTMFVDGRPEAARYFSKVAPFPIDTDTDTPDTSPMKVATSRSGEGAPFRGAIDELYIFDGPLEDEAIRTLASQKR